MAKKRKKQFYLQRWHKTGIVERKNISSTLSQVRAKATSCIEELKRKNSSPEKYRNNK
jgi:hypothetical protein